MKPWQRRRWRYGAGTVVLALAASGALAAVWNGGYEGSPTGGDLLSDLDTFIQSFKIEARFRSSVEEEWGTSGGDNGLNRVGSARAFIQNAAPTDLAGPGQYNNAGLAYGTTALNTNELNNASDTLGKGRLWVDADGVLTQSSATSDDNLLNVWNVGGTAFANATARDPGGAGVGGVNQLYNGGFEVTDGTGNPASVTAPAGWTNLNTSGITYVSTGVSEGQGIALKTTGSVAGGVPDGVRQQLVALKASRAYVFRVRAKPTAVAGGCRLNVSDGVTTVTDTSTVAGSYQTLEAVLTTTAAPATVNVELQSNADTNVCEWDEATAFEQFAVVRPNADQYCNSSDATTATNYGGGGMVAVPGLSCGVTPPQGSWAVEVDALVCMDNDDGSNRGVEIELLENVTVVAWAGGWISSNAAGSVQDMTCLPVHFVHVSPTAGSLFTYTLKAGSNAGVNIFSNDQDGDNVSTFAAASTLQVKLSRTD